MPDDVNGTGDSQPADDIRSALAAAIVTSEEAQAEVAPEKPARGAKAAPADGADAGAGAADAGADTGDGATTGADKAAEKPAKSAKADDAAALEAGADDAKPADKPEDKKTTAAELTGKWSAKDKETFAKLPPEGQEMFLRRHKEMEGAFTKKTQEIAAFKREYDPVEKLFEPWREKMKTAGFTPSSMITAWANVEKRLMDPADAVNVVAGLIKGYKIDVVKLAGALGMRSGEQPAAREAGAEEPKPNGDGQHIHLPPELLEKLQRLDKVEGWISAEDQRRIDTARRAQTDAETRVMTEIETFKSAEDGKGNSLHPHFDEVEEAMAFLASAAIAAKKPVPPLQALYETAVAANPELRTEMIAAQLAAQRDKDADAARAKAAAAKKAASSVSGAPGTGHAPQQRPTSQRSLREELETAAEESA